MLICYVTPETKFRRRDTASRALMTVVLHEYPDPLGRARVAAGDRSRRHLLPFPMQVSDGPTFAADAVISTMPIALVNSLVPDLRSNPDIADGDLIDAKVGRSRH